MAQTVLNVAILKGIATELKYQTTLGDNNYAETFFVGTANLMKISMLASKNLKLCLK